MEKIFPFVAVFGALLVLPVSVSAHGGIPDEPLGRAIFIGLPIVLIAIMVFLPLREKK